MADKTHHENTINPSLEYAIPLKQKGQGVLMKKNEAYRAASLNDRVRDENQDINVKKNVAYGRVSCDNNQ